MGKTLAEKIIAAHAEDTDEVSAGDLVTVKVDVVMANDITAPIAIESFQAMGVSESVQPQTGSCWCPVTSRPIKTSRALNRRAR